MTHALNGLCFSVTLCSAVAIFNSAPAAAQMDEPPGEPMMVAPHEPTQALHFELGDHSFRPGDQIEILELLGDRPALEEGGHYVVSGKVRLGSVEEARLVLSITSGELASSSSQAVHRGNGTFRIAFQIKRAGYPRLSLRPLEESRAALGGTFFGEGSTLFRAAPSAEAPQAMQPAAPPPSSQIGNTVVALAFPFDVSTASVLSSVDIELASYLGQRTTLGLILGGGFGASVPSGTGSASVLVSRIGAQIGYEGTIGEMISLWFQCGFEFQHVSFSLDDVPAGANGDQSLNTLSLVTALPLLFHPVRGVFVGFGPRLSVDLTSSMSRGGQDLRISNQILLGLVGTAGVVF